MLLEETRLFALAFTGKCREKQSGIKADPRARPQAVRGWTNILGIGNKTPAGVDTHALNVLPACGPEASEPPLVV